MSYYKTHSITVESSNIEMNLYRWLSSAPASVKKLPVTEDRSSKTLRWEYGNDKGEGILVYSISVNVRATDDMVDLATSESSAYLEVLKENGDTIAVMQNTTDLTEMPLRDEDVSTIALTFSSAGFFGLMMDDLRDVINNDNPNGMFPNGDSDAVLVKVITVAIFEHLMNTGSGDAYIANYMRWVDPDETYNTSNDVGDEPYLHQWLHRVSIDLTGYDGTFKVGQFLRDFCKAHGFRVGWSHSKQMVVIQSLGAFRGGSDPFIDDGEQEIYYLRPYSVVFTANSHYGASVTNETHADPSYNENNFLFSEQYNRGASKRTRANKYQRVRMYREDDPPDQESDYRFTFDPSIFGGVEVREITTNWANEHEGVGASNILAGDGTVKDYDSLGSRFIHEVYYYQMVRAGVGVRRTRSGWAGLDYANTQFYLQPVCEDIVIKEIIDPAIQFKITGFVGEPKFSGLRAHVFHPAKGTIDLVDETTQLNVSGYGRSVQSWTWNWNARI